MTVTESQKSDQGHRMVMSQVTVTVTAYDKEVS